MRVLIVEDDAVSRELLHRIMERYGDCVTAGDGREGVAAFSRAYGEDCPFDLVLMDIMMPDMDGHACLAEIRRFEAEFGIRPAEEVKVIMVTALDDVHSVVNSFKEGATVYVTKPVSRDALLSEVRKLGLL